MARFTSRTSAGFAEEVSEEVEVLAEGDGDVEAGEEEEGVVEVGEIGSGEEQAAEEMSADVDDIESVTVGELPLPSRKTESICV